MAYGFSISAQDAAYSAYRAASEQAGGRNPYLTGGTASSSRGASTGNSALNDSRNSSGKNACSISTKRSASTRFASGSVSVTGSVYSLSGNSSTAKSASAFGSVRKTSSGGKNELLRALDKQDFSTADMTGEQKRKANFAYTGTTSYKKKGYLDFWSSSKTSGSDEEKEDISKYNYKDVSGDIQRAKTSAAAGSVVIKAKRRVQEIKRKLANGKGDAEELALALSHAKRMERVAKKKQRHLELEELVEHKQDSGVTQEENVNSDMAADIYAAEEEKLTDAQYELDGEQQEALEDYIEENGLSVSAYTDDEGSVYAEMSAMMESVTDRADLDITQMSDTTLSEETLDGLNDLLEDFGSEEQEMLEELQQQLALLETVDPDMSREDLKELKTKHRQSERRDIVKADMDYLKGEFEHYEKKGEIMQNYLPLIRSGFTAAFRASSTVSLP